MTTDITSEANAALLDRSLDISHPFIDEPDLHDALTAAQAQLADQRDEYEGYMAIIAAERGEVLALRKRVAELEGALENFNPRRIGHRQSLSHDALHIAWTNARAALEGKT
jgi:multidrug resistance efflux pump